MTARAEITPQMTVRKYESKEMPVVALALAIPM